MDLMLIPWVIVQDAAWLTAIGGLWLKAPVRLRRPLGLLAIYVSIELLGHGVAEQGAALVIGRLL